MYPAPTSDDILVYLSVPESSRLTSKPTLPKHLSENQFIQYPQEKDEEKAEKEKDAKKNVRRRKRRGG